MVTRLNMVTMTTMVSLITLTTRTSAARRDRSQLPLAPRG